MIAPVLRRVPPQVAAPARPDPADGKAGRGPAPASPVSGARAEGLDRLRGIALVAMLVHHLIDWFAGEAREVLPGWPLFALTDVAAVAFFVAAGASVALFLASRARRGMPARRRAAQVVRRYGLLVPLGMGLQWLLRGDPLGFGVLEALGVTVVLAAGLAAVVPDRGLPAATGTVLVLGVVTQRVSAGSDGWFAAEVLHGTFPVVVYLGFVMVGILAVRSGAYRHRSATAAVAAGAVVATSWILAARGTVPARYPGDVEFVVPGLAGTVLVYGLAQTRWPVWLRGADRLLRRSGTHTLGLFVSHYVVNWVLVTTGATGSLATTPAVLTAVTITLGLCLVAPHVPQPPWSVRTGWRRSPAVDPRPGGGPRPGPDLAPAPERAPAG